MIKWNQLTSPEQLNQLVEESLSQPVLIFKHSTRCSISATALDRLERKWDNGEMKDWKVYYLDLIANRLASAAVESLFGIEHQSPQAIVLHKSKPLYDASHFSISYDDIKASAGNQIEA